MNTLNFRRGGGIATVLTATFAALASQALAADFNNPADKPMLCQLYAEKATNQAQQNIRDDCGGIGPRYTTDRLGHYNWCMAQKDVKVVNTEDELRSHQILRCNRCTGYVDARLEFEKKWNGMGCGEIPELVQMDRYRGGTQDSSRSLLMFSCTYPPMSTYEIADAEKADDAALARCAAVKQEQQVAKVKRAACGVYATDAAQKATQFKANSCVEDARYPGRMSTDVQQHYNWCFNVASGNGIQFERDGRNADLNRCIAAKQIASKIANSLPSTVKFPKTVQKFDHDQLYTPVKKLGVKHTEIEHDKLFTPVTKLGVKNTPPEQPKKIITKSVQPPRFKFPPIVLNFPRKPKAPPVVVTQTQTQTSPQTQTSSKPAPANSDEPRSRSGQTTGDLGFPPKVVVKSTPPTPPVVVSNNVPVPKVSTKPTPPTPPVVVSNQTASDHVVVRALPRLVHNTAENTNVSGAKPGIVNMLRRRVQNNNATPLQASKAVAVKQHVVSTHQQATGIASRLKSALKRSRERRLSRIATR